MLKGSKFYLALLLVLFSAFSTFGQNDKKAASGILIDNTGSLRSQFDQVVTLGKAVARQYGVIGAFGLRRSVFVVGADGRIAWRWVSATNVTFPGIPEIVAALKQASRVA